MPFLPKTTSHRDKKHHAPVTQYDQYTIPVPKSEKFRRFGHPPEESLETCVARFVRDIGKNRGTMQEKYSIGARLFRGSPGDKTAVSPLRQAFESRKPLHLRLQRLQ